MRSIFQSRFLWAALLLLSASIADAERIKDLAQIQGVRTNQLVGYGLVVGLDGTGDQTSQAPFTVQSLNNMLAQFGVTIPPNVTPQLKNVAAVAVHAVLPAFVKPGQTIDITINSIANAKSLRGGSLLVTPLHGLDGQIYAIAQGNLIVSGFGVEGTDGSKLTVNVPSSGRIPNGATVERAVPSQLSQGDFVILNLNDPDFTTATRLAASVNKGMGDDIASVMDGGIHTRARASRHHAARVLPLERRESAGGTRQRGGEGHHQFAHRNGGHQQQCDRESGGRVARLTVGQHQRRANREPAGAILQVRTNGGDQQLGHQSGSGVESHVLVQARC